MSSESLEPHVRVETPAAGVEEKPAQRRTARPPAEPITSLREFFARKTARPQRLLKDLTAANIWQFSDEDVSSALDLSRETDPRFSRTIGLAAAALQADDDRFRRPILAFVWRSAEQRLRDNPRYGRTSSIEDGAAQLHAVARALEQGLHESRRRVESLNLLMAAALWLQHAEGLPLEAVTDELVNALAEIPRLRRPTARSLAGFLAEHSKSGPKGVIPVVGIVSPWLDRAKQAMRRADSEEARAEAETAAHERTQAELRAAKAEIAELSEALGVARREAGDLREHLQADRTHYEHGSGRLRSQIAASLSGRLKELISTAQDALEMDEPRVHVAHEKLEIAVEELEKQAEWLRSSD
jgi:hypothetical protein